MVSVCKSCAIRRDKAVDSMITFRAGVLRESMIRHSSAYGACRLWASNASLGRRTEPAEKIWSTRLANRERGPSCSSISQRKPAGVPVFGPQASCVPRIGHPCGGVMGRVDRAKPVAGHSFSGLRGTAQREISRQRNLSTWSKRRRRIRDPARRRRNRDLLGGGR